MLQAIINNNERVTKNVWMYFVFIFVINVLFKIIYLDYSSYWYDEIISINSASLDFGHIKHVSEWDKNPPFYYYCLSVWIKIFNDSEYCSRLLSVIFSSISAGVLFLFANKCFNKITAFVASLIYLSSNILFFYSHEARAYSLVVLLSLISTFLYFNLKEKPTWKIYILFGIVNFLLIYTHYIAGLVIFFQTTLMLFCFEKKQKQYFSYSLLILLALMIIRFTKKQILVIFAFNTTETTFWLKKADISSLYEVLVSFFFNKILIIPLLILIFFGIFITYKNKIKQNYFALLYSVLLGIGSIIILFLLGKITSIFLDRYLIFAAPFIFILIAYALSFIKVRIIPIVLAVVFFVVSAFNIDYKTDKGMNYRDTVSFVKYFKKNDDLIIVKTKDIKSLFCYYYDNDFLSQKKTELPASENIIFCTSWSDINKDLKNFKRIIVIDSFEELNPNESEFVTKLSSVKQKYASLSIYKGVKITFYK